MSVSGHYKTENCVICGKKAILQHGSVRGSYKAALGNYVEKRVIAGFCDEHADIDCINSDEIGLYGDYDSKKMGKCLPLFQHQEENLMICAEFERMEEGWRVDAEWLGYGTLGIVEAFRLENIDLIKVLESMKIGETKVYNIGWYPSCGIAKRGLKPEVVQFGNN